MKPLTRAVLMLAVLIALGLALWRHTPAPRYQIARADELMVLRLDTVTGEITAYAVTKESHREPPRLKVWRVAD